MNRNQLRQENLVTQKRYENKYFHTLEAAIQSKVNEVRRIVVRSGPQAGITALNNQLANTALTRIVQAMALDVGLKFAQRTWMDLQTQKRAAKPPAKSDFADYVIWKSFNTVEFTKGFGFNQAWIDWIKNYLFGFIVQKITFSVFETTKDQLFTVLNQGIAEGWGIDETVKALDDLPLSATQAARIARTEITRAANAGVAAASETFPFQQNKEWISAHDRRVRGTNPDDHASHVALDGTVVDYEGFFIDPRNGDELRFPGDPLASAESTINCRCSMAVIAKIDHNGRLIPKRQTTSVIFPSSRRRQIITI